VEGPNGAAACGRSSPDKRYRFFFRNRRPGAIGELDASL
jgi:hypothetical protein